VADHETTMLQYARTALRGPGRALGYVRRSVGRWQNRTFGCDVMAEDWDSLLVLDACRYDTFREVSDLPGTLSTRRSKGSATPEFVRHNFAGRRFPDTAYVTANPFVSTEAGDSFAALVEVWREDWDEDLGTVRPGPVREAALEAAAEFPDKRLVVHFLQPHHPFVGPRARAEIGDTPGTTRPAPGSAGDAPAGDGTPADDRGDGDGGGDGDHVWNRLRAGDLSLPVVERAYRENLELVLSEVHALVDRLDGKTVVTSDHGNLLGEPAYPLLRARAERYGHPVNATADPLVRVPWLECPHDGRRDVSADATVDGAPGADGSDVEDRLAALGYV
jgi:hypothetical protein